jgi:myo-inositol-1(or 4)-monophosphatase
MPHIGTEQVLERAVRAGAGVLLKHFRSPTLAVHNKSMREVVTQADIEAEVSIIDVILDAFPHDGIVAEESGVRNGDASRRWILDPLDGTLKFVLGEPYFSVSLAIETDEQISEAIVFNPVMNDLYYARKNGGAYKNGKKLYSSNLTDIAESFVCADWGSDEPLQSQGLVYLKRLLQPMTRGVGVNFSPAMDLCGLAEGRIAAVVSNGTTTEDHSAGGLLACEAGAIIRNFGKSDWHHMYRGIVACSNESIAQKISLLLKSIE